MKLPDFYLENPARKQSGEADYGVRWIDGPTFPRYRVSYIQATGEVYAVCHQTLEVEVLGVVPPDAPPIGNGPPGRPFRYYRTLDRILAGWAEVKDQQLSWVRERLAAVRA